MDTKDCESDWHTQQDQLIEFLIFWLCFIPKSTNPIRGQKACLHLVLSVLTLYKRFLSTHATHSVKHSLYKFFLLPYIARLSVQILVFPLSNRKCVVFSKESIHTNLKVLPALCCHRHNRSKAEIQQDIQSSK